MLVRSALTLNDASEPSSFTKLRVAAGTFNAMGAIAATDTVLDGPTQTLSGDLTTSTLTSNGTTTYNGKITTGSLETFGGSLTGAGPLTTATFAWRGGAFYGTGTTTVTGSLDLVGGYSYPILGDGRRLVTQGPSTWSGGFGLYGAAVWTNSGNVTITGGGMDGTVVAGVRPQFLNTGTIKRATGDYSFGGVAIDNDGVMEATATANDFAISYGTGVSNGQFVGLDLSAANFEVGPSASMDRVIVRAGLTLPEVDAFEISNLTVAGGNVQGRTTLTLRGHFWAYYGSLGTGGMTVILPTGADMEWTAAFGLYAKRFESYGDVTVTETGLGRPDTTWGLRTVWENFGKVTLVSGLFPTRAGDEAARFVNHGTITKTTTGTITIRPVIVNDGVIDIQRGQITATRYEQTPDGTLRFDIGGTAASAFGKLSASSFLYSGRLEATLTAGYTPAATNRFNVITAATGVRSGLFHSASLSGLNLDETATSNIGLVKPSAPAVAARAAAAADPGSPTVSARDIAPADPLTPANLAAPGDPLIPANLAAPADPLIPANLAAPADPRTPARLSAHNQAVRLSAGRAYTVRAPAGAHVALVAHSRGLRAAVSGRKLRVRRVARGRQTLRFRFVAPDGRRSRVATLTVRS